MMIRSPLRMPGGKSKGVSTILQFIPEDTTVLCSPFFGGGSVELACVARGMRVYGYDKFKPLVEFWQCLLSNPTKLADIIQEYYPLSKEKFYELQRDQSTYSTKYYRAAIFYVLNRASFSGTTMSGGMSPNHPRFTQSSIKRVQEFTIIDNLISIVQADFKKSIPKSSECFLYLDPPYMIPQKLYGKKGNMHTNFDHSSLAEILRDRDRWVLSYNNSKEVHDLYKGYKFFYPQWKYGMSKDKKAREVLVLSHDVSKNFSDV